MSVYLGIDIGTQSVKTLVYDAEQRRSLSVESAELEMISESDGTREQRAEWWIEALQICLARIDPALRNSIAAIGVSGQQHGFVPLGAGGQVLSSVKLWCDTSTEAECEQITTAFGGDARCREEVGNSIVSGYTAPKIRWLKNNRPEEYSRLATILLPHDYLNFYLTGELAMEYGDASGTGLLDIRQRCWHTGMLEAVDGDRDLSECLPPLLEADATMGALRSEIAVEMGLPAGIPVSTGGGDNMMAAIGTGNVRPGSLTVSMGTSGTLFAYSDAPVIDAGGQVAAFCSSTGGWLPLLCTMNCTVSTELTRGLLGVAVDELDQRVGSVPAGANGVMTLPFFNGERTPNLPNGKGSVFGLDESNYSADNLLRSAMESAVYGLRSGLDVFRKYDCDVKELRLTGGGARSGSWRQIVADVFDLPVSVQRVDEGAAFGAALQAMWMHQSASLPTLVSEHIELDNERGCQPSAAGTAAYREHYQEYLRHVDAVTSLYS
jgi:xylulokinase